MVKWAGTGRPLNLKIRRRLDARSLARIVAPAGYIYPEVLRGWGTRNQARADKAEALFAAIPADMRFITLGMYAEGLDPDGVPHLASLDDKGHLVWTRVLERPTEVQYFSHYRVLMTETSLGLMALSARVHLYEIDYPRVEKLAGQRQMAEA